MIYLELSFIVILVVMSFGRNSSGWRKSKKEVIEEDAEKNSSMKIANTCFEVVLG
ncbi:hypothetical protein [Rufibacter psychrotolerans]|uniref:hypothetical protein n=1 Tax=Rufibacter psychrotolerans TaxID=2812556 RepID=UPI001967AD7B|nr:hypothetical protein [Rufibacter sp. SYSU D00308]